MIFRVVVMIVVIGFIKVVVVVFVFNIVVNVVRLIKFEMMFSEVVVRELWLYWLGVFM